MTPKNKDGNETADAFDTCTAHHLAMETVRSEQPITAVKHKPWRGFN